MRGRARVHLSAATLATLATIVVLALAGGPSATTPARAADDAALRATLKSELEKFLVTEGAADHISGVSLRVTFRGDKPSINLPVGTTLFGAGEPLSTANRWQIGSNTKAFTSVMLLQLEAEGKLSIHDTLGEWLPRYRAWRHVTIEQLLNMTSGIPDYFRAPFFRAYGADPETEFSPRRLVSYAKGGRPTQGWSYSNTNYILAGMILRKATKDTYGDQLRKRIIKPLGLRTMTYRIKRYPRALTDLMPAGYLTGVPPSSPLAVLAGRDLRRFNLSYARSAGGIVSSLADATAWERALYRGQMLPRKQQRELMSLVSQRTGKPIKRVTVKDPGFGLGVGKGVLPGLGRWWNYEGETLGYRVLHFYSPRSGTGVVVAINSSRAEGLLPLAQLILVTLRDAGAA